MTRTPAPRPAAPRRVDAERNRERILDAARAAFADPDADVSMAEISRRAGVGSATLYRNFASRRELLEALYVDEINAVCQAAATITGDSPEAILVAWLRRFYAYYTSKRFVAAALLEHADRDDPVFGAGYARVLDAERWGDEVFQSVPRRLIDAAFLRRPAAMESYTANTKLPLPRPLLRPAMPLTARLMAFKNKARDDSARADLAALAPQLERIDGWIAEGLLGGEHPNAADLQIGSTIRLLMSIADVRPLIEGRPAAQLTRYFPPMVGEVPSGVLPAAWLTSTPAA